MLGDPRGASGVLVMCDEKREQRAMHEVADLLNNELEERFPVAATAAVTCTGEGEGEDDHNDDEDGAAGAGGPSGKRSCSKGPALSVADEMAAELVALGGSSFSASASSGAASGAVRPRVDLGALLASKRARFMDVSGRGVGLVWVSNGPAAAHSSASSSASSAAADATSAADAASAAEPAVSPPVDMVALLDPVFEAALRDKQLPTRYTSRMIPLQRIVQASAKAVVAAAAELARLTFPLPSTGAVEADAAGAGMAARARAPSFRVEVRARNCTALTTGEVVAGVARALTAADVGMRVCIDAPDALVVVEAVKFLAGVSVVAGGRWERFERYNIRVAAEDAEDRALRLERARALESSKRGGKGEVVAVADGDDGEGEKAGGEADPCASQLWFAPVISPPAPPTSPAVIHDHRGDGAGAGWAGVGDDATL